MNKESKNQTNAKILDKMKYDTSIRNVLRTNKSIPPISATAKDNMNKIEKTLGSAGKVLKLK